MTPDDETFSVSISNPAGGGGPAPSLRAALVSTTIVDDADANSPENVVVQSAYYGLGVSKVGWSTPSEIIPAGYVVEWQEDLTGAVKQSTNLGNGARSYDIAGRLLARWVRVGAVTLEGVNWSAPVFLSDDPLQAWFIDDTPRTGINTCSKEDWTEDPGCRETEISGLDSGTAYVVEIRTHHAVGVSQWTTIVNTHRPN